MLRAFEGQSPRLGTGVFVDDSAQIIGDVEVGADSSFWMYAVVRGDVNRIRIGARCNFQDHCLAHVTHEAFALHVGDDVTLGHHAVVHGCSIGDRVLVGIGARVLDGVVLESDCMVGAGALVPPGMRVPSGMLVMGVPARVARPLRADERAHILTLAQRYRDLAQRYRAQK